MNNEHEHGDSFDNCDAFFQVIDQYKMTREMWEERIKVCSNLSFKKQIHLMEPFT